MIKKLFIPVLKEEQKWPAEGGNQRQARYAWNVRALPNGQPVFDFEPAFARDTFFRHLHWDKFDYAYVITAHAAQGSEYPFIVVIDDSWDDRQNPNFRSEWRYTAATRAKSKLIWVTNR